MGTCKSCGAELKPGASFCTQCGQKVTAGHAGDERDEWADWTEGNDESERSEKAPKKRRRKSTGQKSTGPVSVVIFIFLLVFVSASAGFFIIKAALEPSAVLTAIIETDLAALSEDTGLTGDIISSVNEATSGIITIQKQSIDKLLKLNSVREFIAAQANAYLEAFAKKDGSYSVTSDDVIDLMKNDASAFEEATGIPLGDTVYALIQYALEASGAFKDLSASSLLTRMHIHPQMPPYILSDIPWVVALGVSALLILLLFALNWRRRTALIYTGLAFLLPGAFFTLLGLPVAAALEWIGQRTHLRLGLVETLFLPAMSAAKFCEVIALIVGGVSMLAHLMVQSGKTRR